MLTELTCFCCGHKSIEDLFDICPICFWEKDIFQEENIYDNGGPNSVSLVNARENYQAYGACEKEFIKFVRRPIEGEF